MLGTSLIFAVIEALVWWLVYGLDFLEKYEY